MGDGNKTVDVARLCPSTAQFGNRQKVTGEVVGTISEEVPPVTLSADPSKST